MSSPAQPDPPDRRPDHRSHETPGPDPATTPGLEPGGGVPPGETPPAEGGLAGLSHQEKGPTRWAHVVTIAMVILLSVAVAGFIAGHMLGLL